MDAVLCELVSKSTVSSGACVAHAALWAAGHHCHAEAIPPTSFKRGNALSVALRMEDRKMPLTHNRGYSKGLPDQDSRVHRLSLALYLQLPIQMFLPLCEAAPHCGKKS